MLTNIIIILFIISVLEIIKTNNNIKKITLNYTNLIICVIYSCFFLKLELFGITILLVYSSVFIILILFSFIFNYKNSNKYNSTNNNIIVYLLILLTSSFIMYYSAEYKLQTSWINSTYVFFLKNSQFTNIMHILIVKFFQIEVLLLNYYLFLGLISSILLVLKVYNSTQVNKLMFFNKNKRLLRRTNSFNFKLNNKRI